MAAVILYTVEIVPNFRGAYFFADWRFQKFGGNNFLGPKARDADIDMPRRYNVCV